MTTINVVAFENGVGNSRDIVLLAAALGRLGCEVTITVPTRYARRRRKLRLLRAWARARQGAARRAMTGGRAPAFDLTVMLEHVWPEELHRARRVVAIPNPEFCDRHDRSLLGTVDAVWAKTRNTRDIFETLGRDVALTGFDSVDRHADGVHSERTFLHVAGKSRMKGTERLLAVWLRHPEWPLLTVVQSLERARSHAVAANVRIETRYLSDLELLTLQNSNGFHICTSQTEGWGHYIAEAQSIGAVVIATDAPPMNELVSAERGLLVRAAAGGRQNLATLFEFEDPALEERVGAALALSDLERARLGAAARQWFVDNKRGFPERLRQALERL